LARRGRSCRFRGSGIRSCWRELCLLNGGASPRYCILLAGLTLANQAGACWSLARPTSAAQLIVGATVAVDLGTLGVLQVLRLSSRRQRISPSSTSLALGMPLPLLTIALPIGLSSSRFQAIVCRRRQRRLLPPARPCSTFAPYPELLPTCRRRARSCRPASSSRIALPGRAEHPRDVRWDVVVLIAPWLVRSALARLPGAHVVDPVFCLPEPTLRYIALAATRTPRRSTATSRATRT